MSSSTIVSEFDVHAIQRTPNGAIVIANVFARGVAGVASVFLIRASHGTEVPCWLTEYIPSRWSEWRVDACFLSTGDVPRRVSIDSLKPR